MQSYQGQGGSSSKLSLTNPSVNGSAKMDNMAVYQEQYEASMNPFQVFRGRVSIFGCAQSCGDVTYVSGPTGGCASISVP